MKLKLLIDMENDAFVDDRVGEMKRLLKDATSKFLSHSVIEPKVQVRFPLRDSNGNTVGSLEIGEDLT